MQDSRSEQARQALVERYLRGEMSILTQRPTRHTADPDAPVVAVQTEGPKHPFFLLHGSSEGAAYLCYTLARELGDDQPFYALEPYTHAQPNLPSLDVIAAAHIRSLRSIQAEGPYFLGGICNGGLIAYEMARQLQAEGQRVALVVLMDPWPAGQGSPVSHRLARWVIARGASLRHWDAQRQLAIFLRIYEAARSTELVSIRAQQELQQWLERVVGSRIPLLAGPRSSAANGKKVSTVPSNSSTACAVQASCGCALLPSQYSALFRWAALAYDPPRPYDGVVTYFWPSLEVGNRRGWRRRARHDDATYIVTGTQDSWRGVDLPSFALQLRSCLEDAQARTHSPATAARERTTMSAR